MSVSNFCLYAPSGVEPLTKSSLQPNGVQLKSKPVTNLGTEELIFREGSCFGAASLIDPLLEYGEEFILSTVSAKIPEPNFKYRPKLTEEELDSIRELVFEYRDCFSTGPGHVGCTDLIDDHIDTAGSRPIRRHPYRVSPVERRIIED